MDKCYLCGSMAVKPLNLKDSFTAHSMARCPTSEKLCDRCAWVVPLRCWYWNSIKKVYSKLYSRNWSWLLSAQISYPKFSQERTEGKDTLVVVSELPTRRLIREWLLDPPEPPFTIAIAESGQKHILPWSQEAHSQDYFPVLFEQDVLHIDKSELKRYVAVYENLLALGFSKTEIDTGIPRSERLLQNLNAWEKLNAHIETRRGTRFLDLISYIAIAQP